MSVYENSAILMYGFCIHRPRHKLIWPRCSGLNSYDLDALGRTLGAKVKCEFVIVEPQGSGDLTVYAMVKESLFSAYTDLPINPAHLALGPDWDERLVKFCDVMQITPRPPSWFLTLRG